MWEFDELSDSKSVRIGLGIVYRCSPDPFRSRRGRLESTGQHPSVFHSVARLNGQGPR